MKQNDKNHITIGSVYRALSRVIYTLLYLIVASNTHATAIWDLRSDWSDTANPNGPWSYNGGSTPLPHIDNWALAPFATPQGGWATSSTARGFWFEASSTPLMAVDWLIGDIVVHTQDQFGNPNTQAANVTWTSPIEDSITISGSAWMDDFFPQRGNQWRLFLNDSLLSSGLLSGTDAYSRSAPFDFPAGSGGATALTNVPVSIGDVVKLEVVRTTFDGFFVGTELTIAQVPEPSSAALLTAASAFFAVRRPKRPSWSVGIAMYKRCAREGNRST